MPVLCLRCGGDRTEWLETWRTLTALLFDLGLAGPETTAVGVLYDLPGRKPAKKLRYDACMSVNPAQVRGHDLRQSFGRCPGLRYEVIMGDLPLARTGAEHTRRLADMGLDSLSESALEQTKPSGVGPPLYEIYPCSPIFLTETVPVVEYFQTVYRLDRPAAVPRQGRTPLVRRPVV